MQEPDFFVSFFCEYKFVLRCGNKLIGICVSIFWQGKHRQPQIHHVLRIVNAVIFYFDFFYILDKIIQIKLKVVSAATRWVGCAAVGCEKLYTEQELG